MDEQALQPVQETRAPLATTEHPERVDSDYERCCTAAVFLFCEPLSGLPWFPNRENHPIEASPHLARGGNTGLAAASETPYAPGQHR